MAGSLDISNASTAVSGSGLQNVKETLRIKLLQDAKQTLRSGVDEIYTELRNAWSGQDEQNFESNFTKMIEEVCNALDNYYTQISETIDQIGSDWQNFQSSHVN